VTREGAGHVQSDSLAAESYRAAGEFAQNRNAEPQATSDSTVPRSVSGEAPSYTSNQYVSDKKGPHGKNLKEGGFKYKDVQDGVKKAFNSEPGSIDDPGRLAERKFQQSEAGAPRTAFTRDTDLKTGTAYDGLDRDVNA
jgi:hypothetical protein